MVRTRSLLAVMFGLAVAASPACSKEDPVEVSGNPCPNASPEPGAACPRAGLVCNYFTGCEDYYPATCRDDLTWQFEDLCVHPSTGGHGGSGGAASSSSSSSSAASSSSSAASSSSGSGGGFGGQGGA